MKKILLSLYLLTLGITTLSPSIAMTYEQKPENSPRILELLPNLTKPLAVEPAVPENFIAATHTGRIDLSDWVFWGPKDVLEKAFKNPESLKTPLIKMKLSSNVFQTGPKSFNKEGLDEMKKMSKAFGPNAFSILETQWGNYPVLSMKATLQNTPIFIAWVGLNDGGQTIMFNLVYPNKQPTADDLAFWNNFITKTVPLQGGDYFKAFGLDMQPGYTVINVGGAKFKMIAEKRESDGTIQVEVIPMTKGANFQYLNMGEGFMGGQWKNGQPIVKVFGEIVDNNTNTTTSHTTSIFYKVVPDFTSVKDADSKSQIFQKTR